MELTIPTIELKAEGFERRAVYLPDWQGVLIGNNIVTPDQIDGIALQLEEVGSGIGTVTQSEPDHAVLLKIMATMMPATILPAIPNQALHARIERYSGPHKLEWYSVRFVPSADLVSAVIMHEMRRDKATKVQITPDKVSFEVGRGVRAEIWFQNHSDFESPIAPPSRWVATA